MKKRRRKGNVKIVFPSTITSFCMVFGFIAVVLAAEGHFKKACVMIMLSLIMDGLDGKVARATNTASEFGIQYDSLSDLVAFGVAPSFIYFRYYLHQQVSDQIFYLLPVMYLVCGAVRLARFNVTASIYGKTHFTGLPIPAAAFTMVSATLFYEWFISDPRIQEWGLGGMITKTGFFQTMVVVMVVLSLAMVSTWKFDTPAGFWFHRFKPKGLNYAVFVAFFALNLISFALFAMSISLYYILSMLGRASLAGIKRAAHHGQTEAGLESVDDDDFEEHDEHDDDENNEDEELNGPPKTLTH